MLGNELNCMIQISRFKHQNSTQLLLRFRVRTVCHCNLSVLPIRGYRRVGGLKRFLSDKMSVLPQFVAVAKTSSSMVLRSLSDMFSNLSGSIKPKQMYF